MNVRPPTPFLLILLMVLGACQAESDRDASSSAPDSISVDEYTAGDSSAIDTLELDSLDEAIPDTALFTHRVRFTTSKGKFVCALFGRDAPKTVDNFVRLARKRYFNRLLFHRVAKDFVVQTGNPNMRDKPRKKKYRDSAEGKVDRQKMLMQEWQQGGQSAFGEPFEGELDPETPSFIRGYRRGTVAMANRGPNASNSQFFICLRDLPELPNTYPIFGQVIDGMDIVDSIAAVDILPMNGPNDGMPRDAIVIKSVRVTKLRN